MTKTQYNKINKLKSAILDGDRPDMMSYNKEKRTVTLFENGAVVYRLNAAGLNEIINGMTLHDRSEKLVESVLPYDMEDYCKREFDIEEIKAFKKKSKEEKIKGKNPFTFEHNGKTYGFNYNYFLNIMAIMGKDTEVYIYVSGFNPTVKPIYFKSAIGEAILMPVRI